MVTVVTTFYEKKREKQIKYEKSVLKELTVKALRDKLRQCFGTSSFTSMYILQAGIEEACYDVAIEAYLLGAHLSRFGYYGERMEDVRKRCTEEEKHLIDTLYNFLLCWGNGMEGIYSESLYYSCEKYVKNWWIEGFRNGKRRHKLKLH